jgi:hypothetical protein
LAADRGEQVPQPVGHRPQPAALGAIAQQDLGHGQTDELGVRQPGPAARPAARRHQLIDGDIKCDDEVVEDGAHEACSLEVDVVGATPILGGLVTAVTSPATIPTDISHLGALGSGQRSGGFRQRDWGSGVGTADVTVRKRQHVPMAANPTWVGAIWRS